MSDKNHMYRALMAAYHSILTAQMRQEALLYALRGIKNYDRNAATIRSGTSLLWDYLCQDELNQWRKLFMWSLADEDWAQEARQLARKRFLSDTSDIMSYLNPEGRIPDSFLSSEREEWRAEIEKMFTSPEENNES